MDQTIAHNWSRRPVTSARPLNATLRSGVSCLWP